MNKKIEDKVLNRSAGKTLSHSGKRKDDSEVLTQNEFGGQEPV